MSRPQWRRCKRFLTDPLVSVVGGKKRQVEEVGATLSVHRPLPGSDGHLSNAWQDTLLDRGYVSVSASSLPYPSRCCEGCMQNGLMVRRRSWCPGHSTGTGILCRLNTRSQILPRPLAENLPCCSNIQPTLAWRAERPDTRP